MIKEFNELNEAKEVNFKCWPVRPAGVDAQYCNWIVVVITNAHDVHPDAKTSCQLRIDDGDWWKAARVPNPTAPILLDGRDHDKFVTYKVQIPQEWNNQKYPPFKPLKLSSNANGGAPRPVCTEAECLPVNLHFEMETTPQLMDNIMYQRELDAAWKFNDVKPYNDIQNWGTKEEFEFEAKAIRDFNCKSVYQCWLILCHPSDDELIRGESRNSLKMMRQQCIVIVAPPDTQEPFPKVGEICELAFAAKISELDDTIKRKAKDNHGLKRVGVNYAKGVRLDNPHDHFSLQRPGIFSSERSKWRNYATFKVWVNRKPHLDGTKVPLTKFTAKLDPNALAAGNEDDDKPQVTLDDESSFQAHVWMDISNTTMSVELEALETAVKAPPDSRVGEAFSYIRTFENNGRNRSFNLFRALPHMQSPDGPDSHLPGNLKASFRRLDDDQKYAYQTILSDLPCRVGMFPGGPGSGKTELMLTIAALALSKSTPHAGADPGFNTETKSTGGPILLILEANRPANVAATRVVEHFEMLGRTDLKIIRAYNYNYEGFWSSRRYLKGDEDNEVPSGFNFDKCFPTHRSDHIPQVRRGGRGDCAALTLKEAAQQYLTEHPEEFPLLSALLDKDRDEIGTDLNPKSGPHQEEWYALFSAVLARTDFVITTTVGAAKVAWHAGHAFRPRVVIFDDAAGARELSTLVAIAHFPSAEAWLFTGTFQMRKPHVGSYGNPKLWNPCADQLRHSMLERCCHAVPDMHRLSLNHQAYGDLHHLPSDLFWGGEIQSAFLDSERFPASTMHLLEYCRSLASNPSLSVPRVLVHVRGTKSSDPEQKSKFSKVHRNWVVQRVIRHLVQDRHFRSIDNKPGSIIIATPYRAQFANYRKDINRLMQELDIEHRTAGGFGKGLHREVIVEARTADTVQGHSADVVVYDIVSSQATLHVVDPNRTCVALSRSKQAEIIVMEQSMLGLEGAAWGARRSAFDGSCLDLLYQHCKSKGQVVTVDMTEDIHVEKNYSLQTGDAAPRQGGLAVPRQLPALPPTLALPQDTPQIVVSPAVPEPDSQPSETAHDEDDGGMFQTGEKFGFEMVRKAMELGLNLSLAIPKRE